MKSITLDKHINFVLENYSDISELCKLTENARKQLPDIVSNLINKCIHILDGEFSKLEVEIDDSTDWYSTSLYNPETEIGVYFGHEGNYGYMLSNEDPDDAPYLYSYIEIGSKKKADRKSYIDGLFAKVSGQAVKTKLRQEGIIISDKDYDAPYLLTYPLYREINFESLLDKEKFTKSVRSAVLQFTKTTSDILLKN